MLWEMAVLAVFLLLVFFYDLLYQVIPNTITVGFTVVGWGMAFYMGTDDFIYSFLNTLLGFSILLIPHILGWVGGGDVKMLAALGSMTTVGFLTHAVLYGILLAGVLGLIFLLIRGRSSMLLRTIGYVLGRNTGGLTTSQTFIPLGSCISVAGLFLMVLQWIGGIHV